MYGLRMSRRPTATEAGADALAECDLLAAAVGVRSLKSIAPNLVAGLRKRCDIEKSSAFGPVV